MVLLTIHIYILRNRIWTSISPTWVDHLGSIQATQLLIIVRPLLEQCCKSVLKDMQKPKLLFEIIGFNLKEAGRDRVCFSVEISLLDPAIVATTVQENKQKQKYKGKTV